MHVCSRVDALRREYVVQTPILYLSMLRNGTCVGEPAACHVSFASMRTPSVHASVAVSSFGLGVLVGVWLRHAALRARRVINVAPTSSTPGLSCSMCRKTLPPAAFNARQARRRAEVRKCTRCKKVGSAAARTPRRAPDRFSRHRAELRINSA